MAGIRLAVRKAAVNIAGPLGGSIVFVLFLWDELYSVKAEKIGARYCLPGLLFGSA